MNKKSFFQKILFTGILIISLLSSCSGSISPSLELDDDVMLVSFAYDWNNTVVQDTAVLSCKQTLVYSSSGKEISVSPIAYVKLWVKQDTFLSTSVVSVKPSNLDVTSAASSSGVSPVRHVLRKSFELNDTQVVMAEICYEDVNLSSKSTGEILPHLEITDFSLSYMQVMKDENSLNNYIVSITFSAPWSVVNRGDRGTEDMSISYVKSSVDGQSDQLLFTSYDTGAEWMDKSSFKLFVNKIDTWTLSGVKSNKIYSPILPFSLKVSEKPSVLAENLEFSSQVSLTQTKASKINADEAWNIQSRTGVQTVRFDNGQQNFIHAYSYPIYEASVKVDGQEIGFDLPVVFDVDIKSSKVGDNSKKLTSEATAVFCDKTFEASSSTLLILDTSGTGSDDNNGSSSEDGNGDEQGNGGTDVTTPPTSDTALKYGRIIDFQVSAVLDVDAYQNGGEITKKAVVIRFEEGYYFGVCDFEEDFPTQFTYTQSGYSGFNSAAQTKAGKPFRIARAVVYKDAIKWLAEDNSLIMGIDKLSCSLFGWKNIVGGLYSAFINTYSSSYSQDRYSLTLTAPNGRSMTFQSRAL